MTNRRPGPAISIITPTNDPRYLGDVRASLEAQAVTDWEWIVVPNGAASVRFPDDKRIRTLEPPAGLTGVGALKRFAAGAARSGIIVELDHDDMLTPDALGMIRAVFSHQDEVGMLYSDFAEFEDESWAPRTYDAAYGWSYRDEVHQGHKVKAAAAFELDAASLSNICYAPNHVRAWRRSTYEKIGGHDPALPLGDDYDLVCRSYLATEVAHVARCLYLYRRHDDQTSVARNAELQPYAQRIADRYRYDLVLRWARLHGLPALDLGAAHDCPDGYLGLDRHAGAGVDLRVDIAQGLPFADSSVGVIRAHDFLEHVADKVAMINEIWRVLAPGGWLLSSTPSSDGRGAFQDPTHVSYWNENSFWYYTAARYAAYVPEIVARFQANTVRTYYPSAWHEQHRISYVDAALVALKDGYRPPGLVEW